MCGSSIIGIILAFQHILVNLVINEIDTPSTTFNRTRNERRVAYNYNSIMCDYHKNLNEHGHSIFKWRENEDVHKKVAKKAVSGR